MSAGRLDLTLTLTGRVEVAIYAGWVWLVLFHSVPDSPVERVVELRVSLTNFKSEAQAREWVDRTLATFQHDWEIVMGHETARHLQNMSRYVLFDMGCAPYKSLEEVVAEQVKQTEKNLREWFRLRVGRGHPSKWSVTELRDVLLDILTRKNPALTWPALRDELKAVEPERTPKTGNALRVLAGGFGLKLRELRREAAKRREAQTREALISARPPKRRVK